METWGKWQLIKGGFWLGIGFVVPLLAVLLLGSWGAALSFQAAMDSTLETGDTALEERIELKNYRAKQQGDRLLILGSVENTAQRKADLVELQAELFDEKGEFVYECSGSLDGGLGAGETENFQIRCGCEDSPVPQFSDLTLRVVSANSF